MFILINSKDLQHWCVYKFYYYSRLDFLLGYLFITVDNINIELG